MKTKYITTERLLDTWGYYIKTTLFPERLFQELDPAGLLVEKQNKYPLTPLHLGLGLDKLLDDVLANLDNPDALWQEVRQADPDVIACYFDKLLLVDRELERLRNKNFQILEIPVDWKETVGLLLSGKLFQ